MKINLKFDKYKKDIIELFSIFSIEEIQFTDQADIEIGLDYIFIERKKYNFDNVRQLKKILYKIWSKEFAYESPWGMMTGTKPQKLFSLKGRQVLERDYLVSRAKLNLLEKISHNQASFKQDKEAINLYINIPFCPTRCTYCSFPTIIYTKKDRRNEYLKALIKEIIQISHYLQDKTIKTIYVGGGTPSSFDENQLEEFLYTINNYISFKNINEFTFEAGREDTLNEDKLKILKKYGVNRISINPQSFNKKTIERIDRNQDINNLINLYYKAKDLGFIINMDLIVGLMGENLEDVKYTLEKIKDLRPHNLTIHTLSLKKGAKLVDSKEFLIKERSLIEEITNYTQEFTNENNYQPYYLYRQKEILGNFENIGYAIDGYICKYNIAINEESESILGLGMTSNSKIYKDDKLYKFRNFKNLEDYINKLDYQINEKIKLIK